MKTKSYYMKEEKQVKDEHKVTEHLIRVIINVVKSAEKNRIRNKWGSTPDNVSGMQHTTRVCDIVCTGGCKCNPTPFLSRPVYVEISLLLKLLCTQ